MLYLIGLVIVSVTFAYYATWIDEKIEMNSLPITCTIGGLICLFWPFALALAAIATPFYLIARAGAKRRGDW